MSSLAPYIGLGNSPGSPAAAIQELARAAGNTWPTWLQALGPRADAPEMIPIIAFVAATSGIDGVWNNLPDKGKYVEARDNYGLTALHYAAKFGLLGASRMLLNAGSDINALDARGWSPLILASSNGVLPSVEFLLEEGADPNLRNHSYQQTSLMFAAENGHENAVELLSNWEEVDINATATGWKDEAALIFAVEKGNLASVKALLSHNPDLEKVGSDYGRSPLSWAAECKNLDLTKLLIRAGANLYSTDCGGHSPIDFAARGGSDLLEAFIEEPGPNDSTTEPLTRARVVELGLRYACESTDQVILYHILSSDNYLNSQDGSHRNVVSLAAEHGSKTEMEKLCARSLDFNLRDNNGREPLSWAAADGYHEVLKLILSKGTSVNSRDTSGRTAMSWAAGNGKKDAVSVLLKNNAEPDCLDNNHRTPPSWAAVDREFKATVLKVKISKVGEYGMPLEMLSLDRLLQVGPSMELLANDGSSCRWLHLPANNVSLLSSRQSTQPS